MDLILKTPIEELTPQIIAFNNEELLRQAELYLQKYENIKFDDSTISDAKKAITELNKISTGLNDFRLQTQKVYEKPIKEFKAKIDEVKNKFDTVANSIKETVLDYTERQKNAKKTEINDYYLAKFGSLAKNVSLNLFYKSNWENKSYSITTIKSEIDEIYKRVETDLENIYEMENTDHISLKFHYFKSLNLGVALSEYNREQREKEAIKQREAEKRQQIINWNKTVNTIEAEPTEIKQPFLSPSNNSDGVEKLYTLSFKCELTAMQASSLKKFLIENNIKYEKI